MMTRRIWPMAKLKTMTDLIKLLVLLSLLNTAYSSGHMEYAPQYEHPEYAFSYGVKDLNTGDVKSQWESREGEAVKGHYSVLEPDGSIRTVTYTADAKNGFNAVVKTHGPNVHPITDSPHSELLPDDTSSQSKINHYSKDQEHIVLSSDIKETKKPIEDLTNAYKAIPSLVELSPHVKIRKSKPVFEYEEPEAERIPSSKVKYFYPREEIRSEIRSVPAPNLSKYGYGNGGGSYEPEEEQWKATVGDDTFKYHKNYNSESSENHPTAKITKIPEYSVRKPIPHQGIRSTDFIASKPISLGGGAVGGVGGNRYYHHHHHENVLHPVSGGGESKKAPVKLPQQPQPYKAPGAKNYPTYHKNFKKPHKSTDYSSYFQTRHTRNNREGPVLFPIEDNQEQRQASARIVQSMIKRDKKYMAPSYARYNSDQYYFN